MSRTGCDGQIRSVERTLFSEELQEKYSESCFEDTCTRIFREIEVVLTHFVLFECGSSRWVKKYKCRSRRDSIGCASIKFSRPSARFSPDITILDSDTSQSPINPEASPPSRATTLCTVTVSEARHRFTRQPQQFRDVDHGHGDCVRRGSRARDCRLQGGQARLHGPCCRR